MKLPVTYTQLRDRDGVTNWRIADADDNRIATCFSQWNAEHLTILLNRLHSLEAVLAMQPDPERIVMGEGYAVARGDVNGRVCFVGLCNEATDTKPFALDFPSSKLRKIERDMVADPSARRKFRLVLEVIKRNEDGGSESRGGE